MWPFISSDMFCDVKIAICTLNVQQKIRAQDFSWPETLDGSVVLMHSAGISFSKGLMVRA